MVVSDGEFSTADRDAGQHRVDRLQRAGCALLLLAPPHSTPLAGGHQITLTDPAQSGQLIACAAITALSTRV